MYNPYSVFSTDNKQDFAVGVITEKTSGRYQISFRGVSMPVFSQLNLQVGQSVFMALSSPPTIIGVV